MAGTWAQEWKIAKAAFENKTKQKKPSEKTVLGLRKGTGIEDALKLCDSTYKAFDGETKDMPKKEGLLENFHAAIKTFDAKQTAYGKVLMAAIEKADIKLVKPELDILLKHLHAMVATMKAHYQAGIVTCEKVGALEFTAKTLMTSVTGAIARAKLFAAKVVSSKDAKVFNEGIVKASRDITQNIGNVEKLRTKGYVFPAGDPTNLFKVLTPWAQGQRMMKVPSEEPMIKREAGAFVQAVNGVEKWAKA
jgi:hypothetical protein